MKEFRPYFSEAPKASAKKNGKKILEEPTPKEKTKE